MSKEIFEEKLDGTIRDFRKKLIDKYKEKGITFSKTYKEHQRNWSAEDWDYECSRCGKENCATMYDDYQICYACYLKDWKHHWHWDTSKFDNYMEASEVADEFLAELKNEVERRKRRLKHIRNKNAKKYYQQNKSRMLRKRKEYYKKYEETIKQMYKDYYQKNKDKISKRKKIWAKNNPEKIKEYNHKYYKKNTEKHKEKVMEWYIKNKESALAKRKEYYKQNSEIILRKQKEYYQKNKDRAREYYKKNKDKAREYYQKNKEKLKAKRVEKAIKEGAKNE